MILPVLGVDFYYIITNTMNPYRTYLMKAAALVALLLSLTFSNSQPASAMDCGFSMSSNDITWTFSAVPGTVQNRYLVITNTSGGRLVINLAVSGSEAFTIDKKVLELNAGDTGNVMITFHPGSTAHGTLEGLFTATKDGSDCHQSLKLLGTVNINTTTDVLVADPHEFSFGTVAFGSEACKKVTIINKSAGIITNLSAAHCDNPDFTISGLDISSLDVGASVIVTICYKPHAANLQAACNLTIKYEGMGIAGSLVVYFNGNSGSNNTGGDAILVADPHEFNFGSIPLDSSACRSVIVTNKSNSLVVITGWSKCDNTNFSVSPNFTGNDTLASGSSMTFTICYKPDANHAQASCNLALKYIVADGSTEAKILYIGFGGSRSGSNGGGTTDLCLKTEQGDNTKDAVIVGGSAEHTLYLINKGNYAITVNSASISGANADVFAITSTLPITVPAHSSNTTLSYTFTPTSNNNNSFYFAAAVILVLGGDSLYCERAEGHLIGYVVHSGNTTDSVVRPLFPTEKRTLGIESNGKVTSKNFYFTNNLDVDATVNKVYMEDGTYFTITSTTPTPTPFVLHPGDNLVVVVAYTATDHLVHHDHLMIDADHQLQSTSFDMQGVLGAAAGVTNNIPAGVAVNVSPNPASSFVNVNMTGVQMAAVQIIDLLGNTVATAKANTMWKWNASNIAAGSYIVRIEGTSLNGEQFVTSKRVVVSK